MFSTLKILGYFIKNVGEKAYKTLTQDTPEVPDHINGIFIEDDNDSIRKGTIELNDNNDNIVRVSDTDL